MPGECSSLLIDVVRLFGFDLEQVECPDQRDKPADPGRTEEKVDAEDDPAVGMAFCEGDDRWQDTDKEAAKIEHKKGDSNRVALDLAE